KAGYGTAPGVAATTPGIRQKPSAPLNPPHRLPPPSSASGETLGLARLPVASSRRLPDESMRMSPFLNELTQAVPSLNAAMADTRSSLRWLGITRLSLLRVASHSPT